jgi:Zn-dependent peptidase ImmA (M78 family)
MTHAPVISASSSEPFSSPLTMADLYQRLETIGLSKKYLHNHILPDWWTDEVDQTPHVQAEGALYFAHRLNLDMASLFNEETPRFINVAAKFKATNGTDPARLEVAKAIASRIAEMVAYACARPYSEITALSISEIRNQILSQHSSINLMSVLDFCWSQGIPVIHFSQFPAKAKRFHGMVAHLYNRPVILVGRQDLSPAWLLFILAHELGHLVSGHLSTDSLLVDQSIQLESDDDEENEANQVAAELLLGCSGISYDLWDKFLTSERLAAKAQEFALPSHNDPGVIALNIAWNRVQRAKTTGEKGIAWATSVKALKVLEPHCNAPRQINQYLAQSISWDKLKEDNQTYLKDMLNIADGWLNQGI